MAFGDEKKGWFVVTPGMRRKVSGWKSRIYKRFKSAREFILYLGKREIYFNEKQFSAWITGRNRPYMHQFEAIEGVLKELGI